MSTLSELVHLVTHEPTIEASVSKLLHGVAKHLRDTAESEDPDVLTDFADDLISHARELASAVKKHTMAEHEHSGGETSGPHSGGGPTDLPPNTDGQPKP